MSIVKRHSQVNLIMTKPIVVITGADTPTGLTTVRSLRDYPVEVWGVAENQNSACCKSRYWSYIETLDSNPEEQFRVLVELGHRAFKKSGQKPLLLFSQDEWVLRASECRESLCDTFMVILPDHKNVVKLMDKSLFHEWALSREYPLPKSLTADNKEDLCHAASQMRPPFIVKPMVRTRSWDDIYVNQKFIKCCNNVDVLELQKNAERLMELSVHYVLQEWIAGDDSDVVFCLMCADKDGHILDAFTGRKLWQWPPLGGSTAICTNFDNPEIERISRDLMTEAGFKGLGSVEFKFNRNTQTYQITEPTIGRNNYQSRIAVCAGHNLTGRLLESAFAFPESRKIPSRRAIWVDELGAYERSKVEKNGMLKLSRWGVRYFMARKCFLFADLRDLKPAIVRLRGLLSKRIGSYAS